MQPVPQITAERACPACSSRACLRFADQRLEPRRICDFIYSSRERPEFIGLRLLRYPDQAVQVRDVIEQFRDLAAPGVDHVFGGIRFRADMG